MEGGSNVGNGDIASDGDNSVTMVDVLKRQEEFEEDANAVLGGSDDKECTYSKEYVKRQALYACLTCCTDARTNPSQWAGICLACSLTCHENHNLVELYTKRNFRCDCGGPKFPENTCTLKKESIDLNTNNVYDQNFGGLYCVCHKPYPDPDSTEDDEMIQCILCEDWLHSKHLNSLVPSNDQYSEMICEQCMDKKEFLHDYTIYAVENQDLSVDLENSEVDLDKSTVMETSIANGVDMKETEKKESESAKEELINETLPIDQSTNSDVKIPADSKLDDGTVSPVLEKQIDPSPELEIDDKIKKEAELKENSVDQQIENSKDIAVSVEHSDSMDVDINNQPLNVDNEDQVKSSLQSEVKEAENKVSSDSNGEPVSEKIDSSVSENEILMKNTENEIDTELKDLVNKNSDSDSQEKVASQCSEDMTSNDDTNLSNLKETEDKESISSVNETDKEPVSSTNDTDNKTVVVVSETDNTEHTIESTHKEVSNKDNETGDEISQDTSKPHVENVELSVKTVDSSDELVNKIETNELNSDKPQEDTKAVQSHDEAVIVDGDKVQENESSKQSESNDNMEPTKDISLTDTKDEMDNSEKIEQPKDNIEDDSSVKIKDKIVESNVNIEDKSNIITKTEDNESMDTILEEAHDGGNKLPNESDNNEMDVVDEDLKKSSEANDASVENVKSVEIENVEQMETENAKPILETEDVDSAPDKKRKLSTEDQSDTLSINKKCKLESNGETTGDSKCTKPSNGDVTIASKCSRPTQAKRSKGATFWPCNWRTKLCSCTNCVSMYRDLHVLFLLDDEDTVSAYEDLGKSKCHSSQYEKALSALSSLDRIQQINALTEYNKMKDKLLDFLKSFKDKNEVVKEDDIKQFFAGMKPKREPDGVYFCH